MYFSESSHKARWLFTEQELLRKRSELHASQFGEEGQHQDKKRGVVLQGGSDSTAVAAAAPAPVLLQDVLQLLKFYESKVAGICTELRLPKKVQATALVYFKRYWLSAGVLTSDPLRTLLTCIYLAAKIEESYMSAEELCRAVQQEASVVLRAEVGVLAHLRFDLLVHSPYRALAGLVQDIEDMRAAAGGGGGQQGAGEAAGEQAQQPVDPALLALTTEQWQQCRGKAVGAVDALMLSDAPLLYPPSLLALAGLRSACRARGARLTTYLQRALSHAAGLAEPSLQGQPGGGEGGGSGDGGRLASLAACLDRLDQLGMEGVTKPEQQEVAEIDRKIKQWKACNPLNDPNSSASKQAQAAEAKQKAQRQEAKLRARREAAAAAEAQLLGNAPPLKPAQ